MFSAQNCRLTSDDWGQLLSGPDVSDTDGPRRQMTVQHHRVHLDAVTGQMLQAGGEAFVTVKQH